MHLLSELLVLLCKKVLSCFIVELVGEFYVQISLLVFGWKQKMLHVVDAIWKDILMLVDHCLGQFDALQLF